MTNRNAVVAALAAAGLLVLAPAAIAQDAEPPVDCTGVNAVGDCAPEEDPVEPEPPVVFENTGEPAEPTPEAPTEPEPDPAGDPGASPPEEDTAPPQEVVE